MLCTMKELLQEACDLGRAVGGFNVANMESTMGVIRAAEKTDTPVILQVAEGRLKYSPLEYIGPMMVEAARRAKVRVAVHLDHGKTQEVLEAALRYGFTSVMIDGSSLSLEENIRLTNRIGEMAARYGAALEAELGVIGGNEGSGDHACLCTDIGEARVFQEKTCADALAIAIGNAHGHYHGTPDLNFNVLEEIAGFSRIPLVLHGGSGISAEQFRKAISLGIRKINVATANFDAMVHGADSYLRSGGDHTYFGMNESMVASVEENVRKHIEIFNL